MRTFLIAIALFSGLVSASAQKFAFVDTKYILSHIPEYMAAQQEVNDLSVQWQKEIEEKYAAIEKLEKSYQAEKILLTEEMRKKREDEIVQKKAEAKEMQKKKFGVDGELFKKREELVKPIQDQIYEAIKDISSQNGLMVVFDKSNHSNMLYTNPKHDISDKVIKKLGYKPGETLDGEDKGGGVGKEDEEGGDEENKGSDRPPTTPKGQQRPGGGDKPAGGNRPGGGQ